MAILPTVEWKVETEPLFHAPSSSKAVSHELHPHFPWVLTAHENLTVSVWDYELRKMVYDINLGTLDEDDIVTLHQTAEGSGAKQQGADKKFGQLKFAKFYDPFTKRLKTMTDTGYKTTPSTSTDGRRPTFSESVNTLDTLSEQTNLIIIVTENRVLFFDYVMNSFSELRISSFEHKPQLSVDFFPDVPHICFGGSDGHIRIWDLEKKEFRKKLTGGHKVPVIKLFAIQSRTRSRLLLSGGADGAICLWDLVADTCSPKKLMSSEFTGFSYNFLDGSLIMAETKLTSERYLYSWNPAQHSEVRKQKLKMKAILTSIEPFPHPRFGNTSIIFTVKGDTKLYLMGTDSVAKEILDVGARIPSQLITGLKLKVYSVSVHPLQPHLLACNTNFGVILFYIERGTVPVVAHSHFSVFTVLGEKIVSQELDDKTHFIKRTALKILDHASGVCLLPSPSGKYLCVFYPEANSYQIYDLVASFKLVEEGAAYSFVWAGGHDRFAYLESTKKIEPTTTKAATKDEKKKTKTLPKPLVTGLPTFTKKTSQTSSHGRLRIKEFENGEIKDVVEDLSWFLSALNAKVKQLFGGILLGLLSDPSATLLSPGSPPGEVPPTPIVNVSRRRPAPTSLSNPRDDCSKEMAELPFVQFYSWNTQDAVGSQLPPPLLVLSSDSVANCVALVYPRYVCIFSCSPNLQLIYKINKTVNSGYWLRGAFFYATPQSIECVFPRAKDQPPLVVALSGETSIPRNVATRPFGSLAFVMSSVDRLSLMDALNQLHNINLSDPVFQFHLLAASNYVTEAMARVPLIPTKKHDALATFLVQLGFYREATALPGLSATRKLQIAAKHELFDVSATAICALLDEDSNQAKTTPLAMVRLPLQNVVLASTDAPYTPHTPHSPHQHTAIVPPATTEALIASPTSENQQSATRAELPTSKVPSDWDLSELISSAKKVATAAIAAGQLDKAEQLLQKVSNFDTSVLPQLAVLYMSQGQQDKIKRLYQRLCVSNLYDQAKMVAVFLDDPSTLSFVTQKSSNYSEFVALSFASGGAKEEELISKWNAELQKSGVQHHDLRFLSSRKPGSFLNQNNR